MISINNKEHWLFQQASLIPHRKAVITYKGYINYKQVYNKCLQYSNYLGKLGIKSKDHVGLLFGHNIDFMEVINALWFIGAVPVLLNTRETASEINIRLKQADIKYIIVDKSLKQYSSITFKHKILFDERNITGSEDKKFNDKLFQFKAQNHALILFTSGSSGKPKAVVHTFNSLFQSVKATGSFSGSSQKELWLASLPLYHIGGFMILCRSIITGCAVAFPKSLKHEHFIEALTKYNPYYISIVPTTLFKLINENIVPNKNLKYAYLGGGPSEAHLSLAAFDKGWPVVKVYGSSETCSMITALHPNYLKSKAASSGKPLDKNKLRIKSSHKNVNGGEILVKTGSLFKFYYDKKHTAGINNSNIWFNTGDLGWIDNKGFLYVDTRKEEMIISGGENISAKEVESALCEIPGIKDVYVFPIKDKKWGQIVCAAICGNTISEKEIKDSLREKLSGYKIPKKIFFLNSIPRNEMGKVKRDILSKKINLD